MTDECRGYRDYCDCADCRDVEDQIADENGDNDVD